MLSAHELTSAQKIIKHFSYYILVKFPARSPQTVASLHTQQGSWLTAKTLNRKIQTAWQYWKKGNLNHVPYTLSPKGCSRSHHFHQNAAAPRGTPPHPHAGAAGHGTPHPAVGHQACDCRCPAPTCPLCFLP